MDVDKFDFNRLIDKTRRCLPEEAHAEHRFSAGEPLSLAHLTVAPAVFTLMYAPLVAQDRIMVLGDFGQVPEHAAATIYRQLMETNFYMFNGRSPCFCISPETGHVLFSQALGISGLSPELLCANLREVATQAAEWRRKWDALQGPAEAVAHAHSSIFGAAGIRPGRQG